MVRVQKLTLFLPRVIAQSLLSSGVRPSVRLSITFVHCIQTAEDIIKHFSRSGSPMILASWLQASILNFKGNSFGWGAKYTRVGKICDFRLKSPSISETIQDRRSCHGMLIGSGGSICYGSDDLEWRLTRASRSLYLQVEYLQNKGTKLL